MLVALYVATCLVAHVILTILMLRYFTIHGEKDLPAGELWDDAYTDDKVFSIFIATLLAGLWPALLAGFTLMHLINKFYGFCFRSVFELIAKADIRPWINGKK